MSLQIAPSARVEDDTLLLETVFTNTGSDAAYLAHLSMVTGQPEAFLRYVDHEEAEISFGLAPIASDLLSPLSSNGWPSRSAGERVGPGSAVQRLTLLRIPLTEPDVAHAAAQGADLVQHAVSRLSLVFRYAVEPIRPTPSSRSLLERLWRMVFAAPSNPRPLRGGGFDLIAMSLRMIVIPLGLPQPIPLLRVNRPCAPSWRR